MKIAELLRGAVMERTVTVEGRDERGELHRAQLQIETGFKRLEALAAAIKISLSGSKSSCPSNHASRGLHAVALLFGGMCRLYFLT